MAKMALWLVPILGIGWQATPSCGLEDPNLRAAQQALEAANPDLPGGPDDPAGYRQRAAKAGPRGVAQVHRALDSGYGPESRKEKLDEKAYKHAQKERRREEKLEEKAYEHELKQEEKEQKHWEKMEGY